MPDGKLGGPGELEHLDVLIIGAGISGIGAAYHLQTKCPNKRYAIIEARERLGGTWDLFRYPGIRSDSDMYTLGFSFRPWKDPKAIADGPSILSYLEETAREYGIDRNIRFGLRMEKAAWSSDEGRWTVTLRRGEGEHAQTLQLTCNFLFACTGYYRYDQGYTPKFEGREDFRGRIVHPQLWTDDIDYAGKKVVVIGSGATAMTLVPAMSDEAEKVVMLQRSPTYVMSAPEQDRIANFLRRHLPEDAAYQIARWKNVGLSMLLYQASRRFPKQVKRLFLSGVRKALGDDYDVETHFTPRYNPWDQRVCLVPDGDLFESIKHGRVEVVTDHIERFTPEGIRLRSGRELEADLIVTATGLNVRLFGGAELWVDDRQLDPTQTMAYKAMMVSDVPNMAFAVGYTNASWTLKVDLVAEYVCRLINYMDAEGYASCCPRVDPEVEEAPLLDFDAGYIMRARDQLPRGGSKYPWRVFENYALDRVMLRRSRVNDSNMEFARGKVRRPTHV